MFESAPSSEPLPGPHSPLCSTLHEKWRSSSGQAEYVRGKCWVTDTHPDAKPSSDYLSHTTLVIFYHSKNNSTPCQVSWTAREIFIRLFAFLINYSATHLALPYFSPIFLQITYSSIILNPLLCPQLYTPSWCDGWLCSLLAEAIPWTTRGWDGDKFRGGWVVDEREGGELLARGSSSADRGWVHAAGIKGEQERERGRKGVNKNTKLPTPVAAEWGREREG